MSIIQWFIDTLVTSKKKPIKKYVNVIINGETVKREMGPRGQYKRLPGDPIVKRDIFSTYYSSKKAQSSNNNSRYISSETKHDVFRISGGRCQKCGSIRNLEYDHIHPFSRGGDNSFNNIQLLCRKCNRKKGGRWSRVTPRNQRNSFWVTTTNFHGHPRKILPAVNLILPQIETKRTGWSN